MTGNGGPAAARAADQLAPLGTTRWALWRDAAMRGAGFPAARFLEICDDELAVAADQLDDGSPAAQEHYAKVHAAAVDRLRAAIRRTAGDRRFREAVIWQNPDLVRNFLDKTAAGEPRNARGRYHELVIASYLQRYCLKNDTVGFFGPVGWARIGPEDTGLSMVPGPELLSRRTTYLEGWAVDAVAAVIATHPQVWPWLRPRTVPSATRTGWVVRLPFQKPATLSTHEVRVLRQCDGSRTIRDIAGDPLDPETVAALLRLRDRGVVRIDLASPLVAWPERELAARVDAIPDAAVLASARQPLHDLVAARDAVSAAAGDPDRLLQASGEMAQTFERITGAAATRHSGATYVGRTLVYEDTVRADEVGLGRRATDALAGPLGLLLDSATWLANTVAERYRSKAGQLLDRELARTGGRAMPLLRLLTAVLPEIGQLSSGTTESEIIDEVVGEFQHRWRRVLDLPPEASARVRRHHVCAGAIAERVAREFATGPPLFRSARWHSPDLMISADGAEAIARGDLEFVLGEVHCATNTLESMVFGAQQPRPHGLWDAAVASGLAGRVFTIPRKDSPQSSTRMSRAAVMLPTYVYLCIGAESLAPPPGATVHSVLDLSVRRCGDELVVRHRAGTPEYDFLEVIGEPLSVLLADSFRPFGGTGYRPRISIDRLVVARESWTFSAAEATWAFRKDERQRYAEARRWRAAHGVTERGFVRAPVERKPLAVDFRSLAMVNLLGKTIRRTAERSGSFTITEMLPDLDRLWLCDAAGARYTAELRLIAVDQAA